MAMTLILDCIEYGAGSCRNEDMIIELQARAEAAEAALVEAQRERDSLRELLADRESDLTFEATGRRDAEKELGSVRIALCIFPWESITDEVRRLVVQNDSLREQVAALAANRNDWQPADAAPFGEIVLAHFLTRRGKSRVIRATRVAQHTVLDDNDYGSDYDEKTGEYYLAAGWYERLVCSDYNYCSVDAVVTHYMPLPLPPA